MKVDFSSRVAIYSPYVPEQSVRIQVPKYGPSGQLGHEFDQVRKTLIKLFGRVLVTEGVVYEEGAQSEFWVIEGQGGDIIDTDAILRLALPIAKAHDGAVRVEINGQSYDVSV